MYSKHLSTASAVLIAVSISVAPLAEGQGDPVSGAPVVEGHTGEAPVGRGAPVDERPVGDMPAVRGTAGAGGTDDRAAAAADAAALKAAREAAEREAAARAAAVAEAESAAAQATADFEAANAFKYRKMEEATGADARFQANRTQANMIARDRAEAEAADAIRAAQMAQDRANAAKDAAARVAAGR
jgi:hypothetical protein